jgi:hypothetical protein
MSVSARGEVALSFSLIEQGHTCGAGVASLYVATRSSRQSTIDARSLILSACHIEKYRKQKRRSLMNSLNEMRDGGILLS